MRSKIINMEKTEDKDKTMGFGEAVDVAEVIDLPQVELPVKKMKFTLWMTKFKSIFNRRPRLRMRRDFNQGLAESGGTKFSFKKKQIAFAVFLLLILILIGSYVMLGSNKSINANSDKRAEIADAKSRQVINYPFDFPIVDGTGAEVTKIRYSVENAELHDQIVVQGQKATAVKGKTFLVINLKITNNYDKAIELQTKDYMRLTRNDNPETLAADIHNDPVAIQPISTKYTRLGYAINDSDKNLKIHVGEINGQKQTIDISF